MLALLPCKLGRFIDLHQSEKLRVLYLAFKMEKIKRQSGTCFLTSELRYFKKCKLTTFCCTVFFIQWKMEIHQ
jgi:hypothetical protein